MKLELTRKTRTKLTTIGELKIDGQFECYILEDKDRGLSNAMPLSQIIATKVYGQTAIPTGQYEIVISYSNKFKKMLPLLLDVPGFEGIRIHSGNVAADTEGCLLPGKAKQKDTVMQSRLAFTALFAKIQKAMKTEKVFITILG